MKLHEQDRHGVPDISLHTLWKRQFQLPRVQDSCKQNPGIHFPDPRLRAPDEAEDGANSAIGPSKVYYRVLWRRALGLRKFPPIEDWTAWDGEHAEKYTVIAPNPFTRVPIEPRIFRVGKRFYRLYYPLVFGISGLYPVKSHIILVYSVNWACRVSSHSRGPSPSTIMVDHIQLHRRPAN